MGRFVRILSVILGILMLSGIIGSNPAYADGTEYGENIGISEENNETATESDSQKFNEPVATDYLKLTFSKKGNKNNPVYAYSTSRTNPTVYVLPFTEWGHDYLQAEYIVIDSEGKKTVRDVTKQCVWTSSDGVGCYVAVDQTSGVVNAKLASENPYTITATYTASVEADGETTVKKYDASIKFQVKELTADGSKEQMRCLAYNQILMMDTDFLSEVGANSGKQFSSASYNLKNSQSYLTKDGGKNSAKFEDFYDGVVGDSEFLTYYSSSTPLRAATFQDDSAIYLAFYYDADHTPEWTYTPLFEEALAYYKKLNNSGIVVTGVGLGGTAAKYISYVTGCRSVTFNAKSPLEFASLNNFEELCKYYSYNKQVSLNSSTLEDNYHYFVEPYYSVTEHPTYTKFGLNQMLYYDQKLETVSFSKTELHTTFTGTMWENKVFYMGKDTAETYSNEGTNPHVVFGGNGDDIISLGADTATLRALQQFLKATNLALSAAGLVSGTIGDFSTGVSLGKAVSDGNFEWDKLKLYGSGSASTVATAALEKIPVAGIPVQVCDVLQAGGHFIAEGIFPNKNIMIGGKGDDTLSGTVYEDWYCYTYGDGYDVISDGLGNSTDSIFLMGCGTKTVECTPDESAYNLFHITIDGEKAIDFYSANYTVAVYKGSPFEDFNGQEFMPADATPVQIKKNIIAACPVDVSVYDSSGNQVAQLKDGEEAFIENNYGSFVTVEQDGEYVKAISLYDESCKIEIVGTGSGKMKYTAVYFDENGVSDQYASISDIDVAAGTVFYPTEDMTENVLSVDRNGDGTAEESVDRNTKLEIAEDQVTLAVGTTKQLTITYSSNSGNQGYLWISESPDIAGFDSDGNLVAKSTGTVVVGAVSKDFQAYDTCTVTVTASDFSDGNLTLEGLETSYEYTGSSLEISLKVIFNGLTLQEGRDYTLEFSELTEPGEAYVTVTGTGSFSGQKEFGYSIVLPAEAESVAEQVQFVAGKCRAQNFSDEYSIAVYLHDWLINYASYDYTYTYYDSDGVLLHKTGVCQSYANAYHLLLNEFDIENKVLSSPDMDHAWNIAELDGEWCHIDCTWDDPGDGGAENHDYFGLNDALMSRDHVWDTSAYTACSSLQNDYYLREGYHTFETAEEFITVMDSISAGAESEAQVCYVGSDSSFNLFDSIEDYVLRYNWKYGIETYSISGNHFTAYYSATYGDPWAEPVEFTGVAECPYFALRGPKGIYRLSDYSNNGIILIFGREGCLNTRGLLDKLSENLSDLRAAGVEVMVNVLLAEDEDDLGYLYENYPDFVYTYGNYSVKNSLENAVGVDYTTLPFVFFINKNERITYSSSGYVSDIDGFIAKALEIETDSPLPQPTEDGSGYCGSYYCYTGVKTDAMVEAVRDQLKAKSTRIWMYDGLYETDTSSVSAMLQMIREIANGLKEWNCDYDINQGMYGYYSDIPVYGVVVNSYGSHTIVEEPAVEPTCTTAGRTKGETCSDCGKVLTVSQEISALGHTTALVKGVEATYTEDGVEDCYYCSACEKYFADESCSEEIESPKTIPMIHVLGTRHEAVAATCSATGTAEYYDCQYCDRKLNSDGTVIEDVTTAIDPGSHALGTRHEAVAATCSMTGTAEYYDCQYCDRKLNSDGTAIEDITIAIDPDNHVGETEIRNAKAAVCSETGYTGDAYCKGCECKLETGTVIPATHIHHLAGGKCPTCGNTFSNLQDAMILPSSLKSLRLSAFKNTDASYVILPASLEESITGREAEIFTRNDGKPVEIIYK